METESAHYWGEGDPGSLPVTQEQYDDEVRQLLAVTAPRRFAIVQDWGVRYDSRVAAWGLATPDQVKIVIEDDGPSASIGVPLALRLYGRAPHVTARVCWLDPEPEPE